MPAKKTKRTPELTEEAYFETEIGKRFLQLVDSNIQGYLEGGASPEVLLKEASWWKARCEVIEVMYPRIAAVVGATGGRQNSPDVIRDKKIVERALNNLVNAGVEVTEKSLHREAALITGVEREVAPNCVKERLKRYNQENHKRP